MRTACDVHNLGTSEILASVWKRRASGAGRILCRAMLSPKEVVRLEMAIVDRNRRSFRPDPDLEVDSQTGWRDAVPHIRAVPRAFLPGCSNDADFVLGTQTVTHAVASLAACRISCAVSSNGLRRSGKPGLASRRRTWIAAAAGGSIATRRLFTPTTLPFAAGLRPGREIRSLVRRREFLSVINPPRVVRDALAPLVMRLV
jgi:hypothetical protein